MTSEAKPRALVVSHNDSTLVSWKMALKHLRWNVDTAETLEQALLLVPSPPGKLAHQFFVVESNLGYPQTSNISHMFQIYERVLPTLREKRAYFITLSSTPEAIAATHASDIPAYFTNDLKLPDIQTMCNRVLTECYRLAQA